ncbi:AI-2E family transporter [Vibrio stylophorae]|nr:AI-2E family transporter [Vibrio stylophorae]
MASEPRHWILIVALGIAAFACYKLIAPYIGSIVMAFIIAILFASLHKRIERGIGGHANTAALLSCILLTFMIVIPLIFVISAIAQQGTVFSRQAYDWLSNGGAQEIMVHPYVEKSLKLLNEYTPFDKLEPQKILQHLATFASTMGTKILNLSTKLLGDLTGFIASFFLMLFVLFFLLRDYDKMIRGLRHILPLSRSQEDALFTQMENVAKSAVLGSFVTAIAQGFAGGFAMWLAGFPGLFWGTIMGFASFIPVVGTALIWVPAAAFLLFTGDWQWALFLATWGTLIVGSIDNFLRPILMQGSSAMSTLFIFFSLLGGLQLFGLMGLIYGPVIFGMTMVLFHLYEQEFKDFLTHQDNR